MCCYRALQAVLAVGTRASAAAGAELQCPRHYGGRPRPESGPLPTARIEVVESAADGNDYIEGNGGNDRIYGNLGADDLIGGSSELFGSSNSNLRIDGADLIFGGVGNQALLDRNAEASASALIDSDQRHAADADVIVGDNGNIYRIVDADGHPAPLRA